MLKYVEVHVLRALEAAKGVLGGNTTMRIFNLTATFKTKFLKMCCRKCLLVIHRTSYSSSTWGPSANAPETSQRKVYCAYPISSFQHSLDRPVFLIK
jgi:hypothetical protein